MNSEQLEQLKELLKKWRADEGYVSPDLPECLDYESGKESAYQSCADDLEELLRTFNQDEEG